MCGILGTINAPIESSQLDKIKHRGPDDFGCRYLTINDNKIQLFHRRLSIIDLTEAGHQPMQTSCKKYYIIFNGEIYNHSELRKKLPVNIIFNGHSDTETILYYLKEFGISGVKDFNGIFAFAYVDIDNNKMYLARDPFGVKPLYFGQTNKNDLLFSSEIRPIKSAVNNNEIDKDALATLLRLRYNPSPDTIFKGIRKVYPGHYIEVDLNTSLKINHHSFQSKLPTKKSYTSKETVKLYGQKLEEAVNRQLLADVEVGILLSGGVDSALVAALAQKNSKTRLKAFTIGFDGNHSEDEIEDAAETAQILNIDHHFKKISFNDFIQTIKECTRIVEEPLGTTSIIPMYFLSELAAKHVKVVLTGQGADEPLGGYTRYKSELILEKLPFAIQKLFLPLLKIVRFKNDILFRGINTLGVKNEISRFLSAYELFDKNEIAILIGVNENLSSERIGYFYDLLGCANLSHPVEKMMSLDSRLNLGDDLLNYTDKISMNFSLECRVPMLDLELVKFIESLPKENKVNLFSGKIVHKQFAREILPGKIINRKKKAFQSPTSYWFRKEVEVIKGILLADKTSFSKIFNQKYIAELINLHNNGYNKEKQIFLLLCIYFALNDS